MLCARQDPLLSVKPSSATTLWMWRWCFSLFALPASDRVVTRTSLHLFYDFMHELWSSWQSYFSLRSLFSSARFTQCWAITLVSWWNSCWSSLHCYEEWFMCLTTKIFPTSYLSLRTFELRFQQHVLCVEQSCWCRCESRVCLTSESRMSVPRCNTQKDDGPRHHYVAYQSTAEERTAQGVPEAMFKSPINGVETTVRDGRGLNTTLGAHSFTLKRRIFDLFRRRKCSSTSHWCFGSRGDARRVDMDFWAPLRFLWLKNWLFAKCRGHFCAHFKCMYILSMLAVTFVVPCLSGHMRAPHSSGSGVVAGAPGRALLRDFVVRLRALRAAAVLRSA